MNKEIRPILAAEDEESDRMILEMAFKRARLSHPLVIVRDGQEAVDFLSAKGRFADRHDRDLPALIILDLKMPRMNGFDFLAWVSTQIEFNQIPAVVLSSSSDDSDISRARQLGAKDYFVKPYSLDELIKLLQQMDARWLNGINEPMAQLTRSMDVSSVSVAKM